MSHSATVIPNRLMPKYQCQIRCKMVNWAGKNRVPAHCPVLSAPRDSHDHRNAPSRHQSQVAPRTELLQPRKPGGIGDHWYRPAGQGAGYTSGASVHRPDIREIPGRPHGGTQPRARIRTGRRTPTGQHLTSDAPGARSTDRRSLGHHRSPPRTRSSVASDRRTSRRWFGRRSGLPGCPLPR